MGVHENFGQLDVRLRQALDYDNSVAPADGQVVGWWTGGGTFQPQTVVSQYQRGPIGGSSAATLVTQTYTIDAAGAIFRRFTLTGNPTLSVPTNGADGQKMTFWLGASGADRIFTFASGYEVSPVVPNRAITIASGTWERVEMECRNGTWRLVNTDQLLFAPADIGAATATHTHTSPLGSAATVSAGNTGASSTVTSTAYVAVAGSGLTFVAPPSGKVLITVSALLFIAATGSGVTVSPVVLTGATIGSGTSVLGASDLNAAANNGTQYVMSERTSLLTGLTPGATYNAQAYRKVSGSTGTTAWERVTVVPQLA